MTARKRPPRLSDAQARNFETLRRACLAGDLCLVSCRDRRTRRAVAVICAVNRSADGVELVPLARTFTADPYREVEPPAP